MEEKLTEQSGNINNSKKYKGITITLWSLAIMMFSLLIILNNYKPSAAEIAQMNADKKVEFLNFESQVYSIPKQCDADYAEASKLLLKNGQKAISKFNDAHYSCLDAFNQIQNVKVPDSLSDAQIKSLKSAIGDLTTAYASKRGASESAYKFLSSGNTSKINKAKEEIELSQENLLNAMLKIEQVKKELNISSKR